MTSTTVRQSVMVVLMVWSASLDGYCEERKQAIIKPVPENGKVYIYSGVAQGKPDGIAIPSLYMEPQCIDKGKPETRQLSPSGCCLKYTAHLDRAPGNCGVAWSKAPNGDKKEYWGETNSIPAFDLRGAKKLVVQLRGQKGGESVMIKVGILGDKPFGDSLPSPIESKWFKLTTEWQRVEIEIPDSTDLSRVFTPLCWVASDVQQPPGMNTITFYIDDCYFEF